MMERRIDHAWSHPLGDQRTQSRLAGAAYQLHPIPVTHAALFGIVRMYFEAIFLVPDHVVGAPCLRADIVLRQDTAGCEQQREARPHLLVSCHVFRDQESTFTAHEAADVHDRRTFRGLLVAWPLDRAQFLDTLEGDAGEC